MKRHKLPEVKIVTAVYHYDASTKRKSVTVSGMGYTKVYPYNEEACAYTHAFNQWLIEVNRSLARDWGEDCSYWVQGYGVLPNYEGLAFVCK